MKDYKYLFFDLDGTLTDSSEGITKSVEYALGKFSITVADRRDLFCFIGPPLHDSFMQFYGLSDEDAYKAVEYYREVFRVNGIYENTVYDGIPELLGRLREAGKIPILATSKPEEFSRRILDYFDMAKYFDFIAGATFDSTRITKAQVIRYALDGAGITDKSSVLMIGDRSQDVIGAHEVGIDCLGVLFGFGTRQELEEAGADHIAETVEDIGRFLI